MIKTSKGFTLLELIITIAIAGILVAVATPSFTGVMKNNRLITSNNNMLTALILGKSEALNRGLAVTLCKRNVAGDACDTSAVWSDGWLLFSDQDKDGAIDAGDSLIRVYDPLNTNITLSYSFNKVTFNSLGFADGFNGTFKFCDDRSASYARGLIIANTGQLSQANDSNSDGVREDHTGTNFTCA